MSGITVENKSVVVPGEVLCEDMGFLPGPGTYRAGERIYAERLGLANIDGRSIKIIPLSGKYMPKRDDVIICKVVDITLNGWRLETNSAYSAMLGLKEATSDFIQRGADLTQIYGIGDYVMAQVINVTSQKLVDVSMRGPGLRKIKGGRIIEVNPYKVPRIIGKQGSMISMIKQELDCNILVGQNGLVWIYGEPLNEQKAIESIRKIEQESHISGLTERMKDYLQKNGVR
jgi:exosome complex component RRP4